MILSNMTKAALAGVLALVVLAPHAMAADPVKKEDKNAQVETTQLMKKREAAHKLHHDRMVGRNKLVIAKDKAVLGLHKKRLHHETHRGAKLQQKIQTGQ